MSNKKLPSISLLIYGVILLLGGIFGHLKASSMASLIAGTLSGVIVTIAAFASYKRQAWGLPVGLISTALLLVFFVYRYFLTSNFMPAGLMSLISLGVLVVLVKAYKKK